MIVNPTNVGPFGTGMEADDSLESLRLSHPQFCRALSEFRSLLAAAQQDLAQKDSELRAQRRAVPARHGATKNYLNCQVFMVARHRRRLDRFQEEIEQRLKVLASHLKDEKTDQLKINAELVQMLADMDKMKRRCKHILDVTDRYCVLFPDELHLKEEPSVKRQFSLRDFDDVWDSSSPPSSSATRSVGESSLPSLTPSECQSSSSEFTLPSQIGQHVVRSTLESLGSHLAVIAKTYTRKRGSRDMTAEMAPNLGMISPPTSQQRQQGSSSSSCSSSSVGV